MFVYGAVLHKYMKSLRNNVHKFVRQYSCGK